jgi:methyl-accepting chemotaxis protein
MSLSGELDTAMASMKSGFHMTIGLSFLTIIAIAVTIMSAGTVYAIWQFRQSMIELRQSQAKSVIEATASYIAVLQERVKAGTIGDAEAEKQALATIGAIHFEGDNHLFAFDGHGKLLATGDVGSKAGDDLDRFTADDGRTLSTALVSAAGKGDYVAYRWTKAGETAPSRKVAFVAKVPGWNWMIGSGTHVWEVDRGILETVAWIAAGCTPAMIAFVLFALWLGRGVTRPVGRLNSVMGTMAAGETDLHVPYTGRSDEVGGIARAVEVFRQSMIERDALKVEESRIAEERHARAARVEKVIADFRAEAAQIVGFVRTTADDMNTSAEKVGRAHV